MSDNNDRLAELKSAQVLFDNSDAIAKELVAKHYGVDRLSANDLPEALLTRKEPLTPEEIETFRQIRSGELAKNAAAYAESKKEQLS